MLVGLIVTLKVYWLALAFKRKAKPVQTLTLNGKVTDQRVTDGC
jgi:hypothetical protein